jgi:ethanolamine kinase
MESLMLQICHFESHNDLLPANIMLNQQSKRIQFIDFEYGGVGYAAYDIANHLNEYAGGTSAEDNGVPDYSRFPTPDKQKAFCEEYLRAVRRYEGVNNLDAELHSHEVNDLLGAVLTFLLVNHLYWGLWAVNQAAEEGCDGFDYISFATNRFKQFYAMKET